MGGQASAHRRYSEFVSLLALLRSLYPGLVLPVLPEKSIRAKIPLGSFNSDFLSTRRVQLLLFLQKLLAHPETRHAPLVREFLLSDLPLAVPPAAPSLLSTSKSMLSSYFSPPKQPEPALCPVSLRLQNTQCSLLTLHSLVRNSMQSQQSALKA